MKRPFAVITPALIPSALATLLTACGGGGSSSPAEPPKPAAVVVTPAADTATLPWNLPGTIKVLANDTASRGALTLSAVGTPANGTAKLVGNDVEYTPKADFVGTDTFSYTAKAEDGVTANGTITLTVQAALTLKGVVTDGPIANAAVTAKVGTQSFTTTADAQGAYSLAVTTSTPADAVQLSANGVGAQSHVKLTATLGDLASLYKQADKAGVLAGAGVTHYSTALAALLADANAGQAPATVAKVAELGRSVAPERLLELATAIKLVVDKGVPLPTGVADTSALVANPGTSTQLQAFITQQQTANAAQLAATRDEVLAAAGVPGASFAPTVATQRFFYVTQLGAIGATQVVFQPDGTGRLTTQEADSTGKWSFDATLGDVVFSLDTPRSNTGTATDPATGQIYEVRQDIDLYRLKQIAGDAQTGSAVMQIRARTEILSGARKGETQTLWSNALHKFTTQAQMTPFKASEFSAGMKFAGIAPLADIGLSFNTRSGADILELTGATTARLLRSGEQLAWKVGDDGALVIGQGDLERRYYDLGLPDGFNVIKWLAVKTIRAGALQSVDVVPATSLDDGGFVGTLLGPRWAAQLGRVTTSGVGSGLDYVFQQDGSGQRFSVNLVNGTETAQNLRWSADWARGSALISTLTGNGTVSNIREWRPLNSDATGSCFSVLEQVRTAQGIASGPWRLNVLTRDRCSGGSTAPATPAALGTLVSSNGEKFALRVSLTLDAKGLITGGDYDFHTTKGTLTPCTATPDNTGPNGSCFGSNNSISTSSQSGAIPRTGTTTAITLDVGPDSWGYRFTGTLTGKVWSGSFTKASTANSAYTDTGTFSVEVSIP
ncbi:Ig-like domain-containing protein [Roseateles sp. LKC17W]|uniref:Ig-like domain-containing protein n=1 Tax=Pelomonas margarita TaxID=3299031 RepID=A0ABW7FFQ4_9BURK